MSMIERRKVATWITVARPIGRDCTEYLSMLERNPFSSEEMES